MDPVEAFLKNMFEISVPRCTDVYARDAIEAYRDLVLGTEEIGPDVVLHCLVETRSFVIRAGTLLPGEMTQGLAKYVMALLQKGSDPDPETQAFFQTTQMLCAAWSAFVNACDQADAVATKFLQQEEES